MSDFKPNPGSIFIFPNAKNKDKQPDVRGTCNIDDVLYEVSLWKKADRNGNTFYSGKIEKK